MTRKRFLWNLRRKDVMNGCKAFITATRLKAGSIDGGYNLYTAILHEWMTAQARQRRQNHE